jgi:hypothetical protein
LVACYRSGIVGGRDTVVGDGKDNAPDEGVWMGGRGSNL